MSKLNGDAKVIVNEITNLKELLTSEFDKNRDDHKSIFKLIGLHGEKLARNSTYIKVGAGIACIIIGILIKLIIG